MQEEIYRLFIAIPAPAVFKNVLRELRNININLPGIRWIPEENLHITVYFLGNVISSHVRIIKSVMENFLKATPDFTLHFHSVTLEGGRPSKPSMVWARFNRNEMFSKLANTIGEGVSELIIAPAKFKDPVPHITLARIKSGDLPVITSKFTCEVHFTGYELWRSISTPAGVKYESLYNIYK